MGRALYRAEDETCLSPCGEFHDEPIVRPSEGVSVARGVAAPWDLKRHCLWKANHFQQRLMCSRKDHFM
jgi:hypothetical protein